MDVVLCIRAKYVIAVVGNNSIIHAGFLLARHVFASIFTMEEGVEQLDGR